MKALAPKRTVIRDLPALRGRAGYSTRGWTMTMVGALALIAVCPRASAAWGSLRANNRSAHEEPRGGGRAGTPGGMPSRGREGTAAPREYGHEGAPAFNRGGGFEPDRRAEIDRDMRERRHLAIDEDRRHSYYWFGYHPGMAIDVLPPGYLQVYVGGTPYDYYQGVYYESTPSGYVVVTPPPGAVVPALPPGAEAFAIGPNVYYYAAGAFYLQQPQGYVVVTPPLGVTVTTLPPGAIPVILNGVEYYQADGAYFLPSMQGGVTVYTTVAP